MSRRLATICLHWANLVLLLMLPAAGSADTALAWAFSVSGLSMVLFALVGGIMNGPGPKLEGAVRKVHPWLSRFIYGLLAWVALATLSAQLSLPLPGPDARQAQLTLLGASLLHGCFHLWRASALNDGALRRMLP